MNTAQIEKNLQELIKSFKKDTFIFDLLLAYGLPKASISRLQKGGMNLSKIDGDIIWKKKLYFKAIKNEDVHEVIENSRKDTFAIKHNPRFIIVTDFKTFLAIDTKTSDTLDIPMMEIPKHYDFFLPWAGMEKTQHQDENPADVKAAERMAKLYDEITKDNSTKTPEEVHNLNAFLSRLLFCYFAEDTGIFEKNQFTNALSSHTHIDGNDLHTFFNKLFEVLNTETGKRKNMPEFLEAFPYVNGGLYREKRHAPVFTRRSRQIIIDSGQLDWSAINPDIFGSMIQAVITPEHRGGLGMHYTSVPNIMKVIEPLFLNELNESFMSAKGNNKKLNQLLERIYKIKIFDPACGSGNFLIISYKELRRLEMKIFKSLNSLALPNISLGNFYGIELDDFAHEVAMLSLWLAEHQMNQAFFKEFGRSKPALPLKETGCIVRANACRIKWEEVCPKKTGDEIYILGNPPYLGARILDEGQKSDMKLVFQGKIEGYNDLDYIACWFCKGAEYIKDSNSQCAFVSTNSICQGSQVSNLWPKILSQNTEIGFAYRSFKWTNNAKAKAAVIVIIVGIRNACAKPKYIFDNSLIVTAKNISPYLIESENVYVYGRREALSKIPAMSFGSMPNDDGHLILNTDEYKYLLEKYPDSRRFLKRLIGSKEFINDIARWCIWIDDEHLSDAMNIDFIKERVNKVKQYRKLSDREATNSLAIFPHRFAEVRYKKGESIIIPRVSSEKRIYMPIGFLNEQYVISDSAQSVYNAEPWVFSMITSRMHMTWMRAVAGRLKSDYRYSTALCYNTFPFPAISDIQKKELDKHVHHILEEREKHSEKTLAQLYDPKKMPESLHKAHLLNDLAVERCYRSKEFESEEERLEYLFKLYEQMIAEENTEGTLFKSEKKKRG